MRTMAMLLSLTLALLCVLQAQAEVPVQPGFDADKFSGMWHILAAVSNCPIFQKMKDSMTTSAAIITFTPEGNLNLKVGYPVQDSCKKMEMLFEKTGQPGHYSNSQKGTRDLRVMETDYEHYAIMYTFKQGDEERGTTLQLLSRTQEVSPEALKRLKELYPPMGLTDNMLVVLPKSGLCAKALST
ncbi:lipocalin-15 [Emydura macquarii macquarii]|uniref:lipocalin-15 n=1 Tax=Emydura macquarii macquarii TaxID=1129001 RepID=UPI00352AA083